MKNSRARREQDSTFAINKVLELIWEYSFKGEVQNKNFGPNMGNTFYLVIYVASEHSEPHSEPKGKSHPQRVERVPRNRSNLFFYSKE